MDASLEIKVYLGIIDSLRAAIGHFVREAGPHRGEYNVHLRQDPRTDAQEVRLSRHCPCCGRMIVMYASFDNHASLFVRDPSEWVDDAMARAVTHLFTFKCTCKPIVDLGLQR